MDREEKAKELADRWERFIVVSSKLAIMVLSLTHLFHQRGSKGE